MVAPRDDEYPSRAYPPRRAAQPRRVGRDYSEETRAEGSYYQRSTGESRYSSSRDRHSSSTQEPQLTHPRRAQHYYPSEDRSSDRVTREDMRAADELESWSYPAARRGSVTSSRSAESRRQEQYASRQDSAPDRYLTAGMEVLRPSPAAASAVEHRPRRPGSQGLGTSSLHTGATKVGRVDADAEDTSRRAALKDAPQSRWSRMKSSLTRTDEDEEFTKVTLVLQIVQIIVTALGGALLFWGFGVLWSKPGLSIVTFCVAMVVQVAFVAIVRVLRRKEEFWILLLAWAVAFFVTVGPLVVQHQ